MQTNHTLIFAEAPASGWPLTEQHLAFTASPFDTDAAAPEGGLITKNIYFSLDPGLRLRLVSPDTYSYAPPFKVGAPIDNTVIAAVLKSGTPALRPGDVVLGRTAIEEYSRISPAQVQAFRKIEPVPGIPLTEHLGALGIPGLTAYGPYYEIGKPVKGETLYVSGAAGAIGHIVGQLAKADGLRVIGSVGTDEKLDLIKSKFGFDDGFNYKKENSFQALGRLAPDGIDIFYDNVGGEALDAGLMNMSKFGRIISCGFVSQYTTTPETEYRIPATHLGHIPAKRLTMRGFITFDDNIMRYAGEHKQRVSQMLLDGQLKSQEDITVGIENAVDALLGVLKGKNQGKAILQVSANP